MNPLDKFPHPFDPKYEEKMKKLKRNDPDKFVNWPLVNGNYSTKNGSRVTIFGKRNGCSQVDFDWFEEGGCVDCIPQPYPEKYDNNDVRLVWHCDVCGGGSAKLYKDK